MYSYIAVIKYQHPPLPRSKIAVHPILLNKIYDFLCGDSHTYGATLILTGEVEIDAVVKRLCHHSIVKKNLLMVLYLLNMILKELIPSINSLKYIIH